MKRRNGSRPRLCQTRWTTVSCGMTRVVERSGLAPQGAGGVEGDEEFLAGVIDLEVLVFLEEFLDRLERPGAEAGEDGMAVDVGAVDAHVAPGRDERGNTWH